MRSVWFGLLFGYSLASKTGSLTCVMFPGRDTQVLGRQRAHLEAVDVADRAHNREMQSRPQLACRWVSWEWQCPGK